MSCTWLESCLWRVSYSLITKKLHDAQIFALVILNLQSCRSVSFWSKSTSGSGYANLFWIRIWAKIYFFLHFLLKIIPLKTIIFMMSLLFMWMLIDFYVNFPHFFCFLDPFPDTFHEVDPDPDEDPPKWNSSKRIRIHNTVLK